MELVHVVRWLHVIGAAVLLGTGAGIAFFMMMAHRSKDARAIAHVGASVVIADWIFTASAVVLQPITGAWLAYLLGWRLTEPWILLSLGLYVVTGGFWIPVIFMQKKMRDLARMSAEAGVHLPDEYFRLYRRWFACGIPAFLAVLAIIALMIVRPPLG